MDPVDDDGAASAPASPEPARVRGTSSIDSTRLDRWLSVGLWVAVVAVVAFAGFFAYSVYAQQQAARLSSPTSLAIDALQQQVNAKPSDPELHSRLAEALGAAGQLDQAKRELQTALQLDPNYLGAYQNLATIELMQKDYADSAAHWQKVLDLTADSQMQDVNQRRDLAYFSLGEIALVQKDYVGAVGYFNAALRIRKDASDTYLLLAKAYMGLGQNDQAMDKINAALAFEPKYAEAHYLRGKIYLAQGDSVNAAWDFRAALDAAPDNPEAQAAIESLGSYESWYGKAAAASASKDTSAALAAVQIARAIQPGSYDAAMLDGQVLESKGDAKDAVDAYTVALKIKPNDPAATAALTRATAASKG
jgi:tetratricopeptide (TPR) repeat protein